MMRTDRRSETVSTLIEGLYRSRFRAFLGVAAAITRDGDVAYDVVQDAFAQALRSRATFRGEGSVEAWLWRIVLNRARDEIRNRKVRPLPKPAEPAMLSRPTVVSETVTERITDLTVRRLIARLSERQRLIVFLRYYADLEYAAIAALLEISPGTVAASLSSAHARIRNELKEIAR